VRRLLRACVLYWEGDAFSSDAAAAAAATVSGRTADGSCHGRLETVANVTVQIDVKSFVRHSQCSSRRTDHTAHRPTSQPLMLQ